MSPKNWFQGIGDMIGAPVNTMPVDTSQDTGQMLTGGAYVTRSSPFTVAGGSSGISASPSASYTPVAAPSAAIGGSNAPSNDLIAAALIKALNPGASALNNMSLPNPPTIGGDTVFAPTPIQSGGKQYPAQAGVIYLSAILGIGFTVHYFYKLHKEKE